jgi:hypothetical protein
LDTTISFMEPRFGASPSYLDGPAGRRPAAALTVPAPGR